MDTEKLRRQLIDRITENYSEYRANLLLYSTPVKFAVGEHKRKPVA